MKTTPHSSCARSSVPPSCPSGAERGRIRWVRDGRLDERFGEDRTHLLRERSVATIGLTSAARRAWVEGLGLYDVVMACDEVHDLDVPDDAVLVDFAGDRALLRELHELGDALVCSIRVGLTHWSGGADEAPLRGPAPEFFFAPDEMARRGHQLAQRYLAASQVFAPGSKRAMGIERVSDGDKPARIYRSFLNNSADPGLGYVVSLHP